MNFDQLSDHMDRMSKEEINKTTLRNIIQGRLMMEDLGESGVSNEAKVLEWVSKNAKRISDAIEADDNIIERWEKDPEAVLAELK